MRTLKMLTSLALSILISIACFGQNEISDPAKLIITLTDYEKAPLSDKTLVVVNNDSQKEYKSKTNEEGKVTIKVPKGNNYKVIYRAVNGPVEFKSFKIPDKEGSLTFQFTARYEEAENQVYTLENVYFDTDKATLRESSNDALQNLLNALKTNPDMEIEIAGHTDSKADAEYNKKLSQRRAESVKQYLVERGISEDRLKAKGYGESEPIATNKTEQGRQKNRRTEVRILKE